MRCKTVLSFATLAALVATLAIGCDQGTDVQLAKAPPPDKPAQPGPLPKEARKGGGPASSGNMQRNPGADPGKPPGQ
jgi:hypothetical protein